ncbi:hypothetical protein Bca101_088099 [Brassica carinata]
MDDFKICNNQRLKTGLFEETKQSLPCHRHGCGASQFCNSDLLMIVRKTFVVGEGQDIKKELVVAGGIIFFFTRKNFNIRKKRSRTGFVRGDSSGGNIAHNVAVRIGD